MEPNCSGNYQGRREPDIKKRKEERKKAVLLYCMGEEPGKGSPKAGQDRTMGTKNVPKDTDTWEPSQGGSGGGKTYYQYTNASKAEGK